MSTAERPDDAHLEVLDPLEALARAGPLPPPEEFGLDEVTDEEWEAFHKAIAER